MFDPDEHFFVIDTSPCRKNPQLEEDFKISRRKNIILTDSLKAFSRFGALCFKADRVIFHSAFLRMDTMIGLSLISLLMPKKFVWSIWGDDLFVHIENKNKKRLLLEAVRRIFFRRQLMIVSPFLHDYELACRWYGVRAEPMEAFYPFTPAEEVKVKPNSDEKVVLLGGCGKRLEEHIDMLAKVRVLGIENIKVFCPLYSGRKQYVADVIESGKILFGDKFVPVTEKLSPLKYSILLNSVDVAVFGGYRELDSSSVISLIGLGKKVYLNSMSSLYDYVNSMGIEFCRYDLPLTSDILTPLTQEQAEKNKKIIAEEFTRVKIRSEWSRVFY